MKSLKGRGATINPDSRFSSFIHQEIDDGWKTDEPLERLNTTIIKETAKTVITYNQSPDLPFDRSINPYRGCEHGCSYCYARPTHSYLNLSPGLDFETQLYVKSNLKEVLKKELRAKKYQVQPIVLGANTDPYQPIEKKYQLTRSILQILNQCRHPVIIVSKGSLMERDIDILSEMAKHSLVQVMISITTLDKELARKLEPRAASPERRLKLIQNLNETGIPTGVMIAPIIPQLSDSELENILQQASTNGSKNSAYVMLRLPREVTEIFSEWLFHYYPLKALHVLNTVREIREGKTNDSNFGSRLTGKGPYASMIAQRFRLQCKKLGLNLDYHPLDNGLFVPPAEEGPVQMNLF